MEKDFHKLVMLFALSALVLMTDSRPRKLKNVKRLNNGETMVLKPRKTRLKRIYLRMEKYYTRGMTLDKARKRNRFVNNLVVQMEERSRKETTSPGKYVVVNLFTSEQAV